MDNQFMLFSGHFHRALYFEYDKKTKTNKQSGVSFRFKQKEITQKDFSTGKESVRTQEQAGRVYAKRSFSISTLANLPFKINDKISVNNENKVYTIVGISEGFDSIYSMSALQFNDTQFPRILVLE